MAGALSMSMWSGHASSTRTYTRNEGFLDERGDYGALPDTLWEQVAVTSVPIATRLCVRGTHRRRRAVFGHLFALPKPRTPRSITGICRFEEGGGCRLRSECKERLWQLPGRARVAIHRVYAVRAPATTTGVRASGESMTSSSISPRHPPTILPSWCPDRHPCLFLRNGTRSGI